MNTAIMSPEELARWAEPKTELEKQLHTALIEALKDPWDEKRIDAIGQNGNDGLHYKG